MLATHSCRPQPACPRPVPVLDGGLQRSLSSSRAGPGARRSGVEWCGGSQKHGDRGGLCHLTFSQELGTLDTCLHPLKHFPYSTCISFSWYLPNLSAVNPRGGVLPSRPAIRGTEGVDGSELWGHPCTFARVCGPQVPLVDCRLSGGRDMLSLELLVPRPGPHGVSGCVVAPGGTEPLAVRTLAVCLFLGCSPTWPSLPLACLGCWEAGQTTWSGVETGAREATAAGQSGHLRAPGQHWSLLPSLQPPLPSPPRS